MMFHQLLIFIVIIYLVNFVYYTTLFYEKKTVQTCKVIYKPKL